MPRPLAPLSSVALRSSRLRSGRRRAHALPHRAATRTSGWRHCPRARCWRPPSDSAPLLSVTTPRQPPFSPATASPVLAPETLVPRWPPLRPAVMRMAPNVSAPSGQNPVLATPPPCGPGQGIAHSARIRVPPRPLRCAPACLPSAPRQAGAFGVVSLASGQSPLRRTRDGPTKAVRRTPPPPRATYVPPAQTPESACPRGPYESARVIALLRSGLS